MKNIYYGKQSINEDDVKAVNKVLKSDLITQGPAVAEFEKKLSQYCGARYAVAFSSGTAALHGAYFASGLKENDEIITSPISFAATTNAALYLGGKINFTDIELRTGNIDADLIEKNIKKNTKIIVPVHYAGNSCKMEEIKFIADNNDLIVIEDACHALGGEYNNKKIGSCEFSEMSAFSFHPVKSITTAEGGAVTTNSKALYDKLCLFRNHGITKEKENFIIKNQPPWYYEMQELGFNYRLSDIQGSLGLSQISRLDEFMKQRKKIADIYDSNFENNSYFDILEKNIHGISSNHLYPILLKDKYIEKKEELYYELKKKNIIFQVHYIPITEFPYYKNLGYSSKNLKNSYKFYDRSIHLLL